MTLQQVLDFLAVAEQGGLHAAARERGQTQPALSRSLRRLEADLAPDARLLAVEATIFGRQAHGETVRAALFADRWRIRRDGSLIHAENLRLSGDVAQALDLPAVTGGDIAVATVLLACAEAEALVTPLRRLLAACPQSASRSTCRCAAAPTHRQ